MTLKIKKRSQKEWLVLCALMLPFLFFFFVELCQLPSAVKYIIDVLWIFLLLLMLLSRAKLPNRQSKIIALLLGLFSGLTLIGFVLEFQSPLYYLWGIRNNIRFFVLFIACVMYLSKEGADSFLRLMDKLFYINFAVTIYQFTVMRIHQDNLGGIFGVEKGCNGYTNIFLLIVVIWHVLHYMNGKENFTPCMVKVLISLLIAALAELKIFFVEFVLVVVLATLITKFSARKLWIIVIGAIGFLIGLEIINNLFPYFANWFKMAEIIELLTSKTGYTNSNDINRLTFYPIIMERFLDTWPRKLFGLGLGNCDYAEGYDFLTTPFYIMNRNLHYEWFSSAFLLLETGIIGLGLYLWIFVQIYFGARQREKKGLADPTFCQMARIMAIMCPILVIYNGSLRTEAGYMVYFVLALPFLKKDGRSPGGVHRAVRKEALLDGKN